MPRRHTLAQKTLHQQVARIEADIQDYEKEYRAKVNALVAQKHAILAEIDRLELERLNRASRSAEK